MSVLHKIQQFGGPCGTCIFNVLYSFDAPFLYVFLWTQSLLGSPLFIHSSDLCHESQFVYSLYLVTCFFRSILFLIWIYCPGDWLLLQERLSGEPACRETTKGSDCWGAESTLAMKCPLFRLSMTSTKIPFSHHRVFIFCILFLRAPFYPSFELSG